jgi:hypothetical protein
MNSRVGAPSARATDAVALQLVLLAPIKRTPGAGEHIRYAEADQDRHEN